MHRIGESRYKETAYFPFTFQLVAEASDSRFLTELLPRTFTDKHWQTSTEYVI
jgi:hypothetical protein